MFTIQPRVTEMQVTDAPRLHRLRGVNAAKMKDQVSIGGTSSDIPLSPVRPLLS
jgi:hypothetical protein